MNDLREPGHPVGSEMDDSQNPTAAAPTGGGAPDSGGQRDMLRQLQQMIDQVAAQAGPPMREIAAKAAELAAIAAQRAGPLAAKAAEKTQVYGERFAAKSKEMAADLRSTNAATAGTGAASEAPQPPSAGEWSSQQMSEEQPPAAEWSPERSSDEQDKGWGAG